MSHELRSPVQRWLGCLALWLALAPANLGAAPAATSCPEGTTPAPFVSLATIDLPDAVPAGASIDVVEMILAPGEELQPETHGYTAFSVIAGLLEFQAPPRGGFHLEHPAHCLPANGVFSAGGVETIDAEGWMRAEAGATLVADEVPIARLRNAGSELLQLVVVSLRLPEVDRAMGQPSGDELVSDRGPNRADRQERRDRRHATATP